MKKSTSNRLIRFLGAILILVLSSVLLSACHHKANPQTRARKALQAVSSAQTPQNRANACDKLPEGYGYMGACVAKIPNPSPPSLRAIPRGLSGQLGIDTSHWDYCSSSIIRAPRYWFVAVADGSYVDRCQGRVYGMLRRAGIPHGTYFFVRQYLNPISEADHYVRLLHQLGWSRSDHLAMLPVDDAEALSSCSFLHSFDSRVKSQLGLSRMIDYDAPGLWAGCAGRGNIDWTADYGFSCPTLSGFSFPSICQFTDGHFGPAPHCWGVCGDVDRARVNISSFEVTPAPAPRPKPRPRPSEPIPYKYWRGCATLDHITWWLHHHGSVSEGQHHQSVVIRELLHGARIGCSAQPHSYPFRLPPPREGALSN